MGLSVTMCRTITMLSCVISLDINVCRYHIPTIHPGLNKEVDMKSYRVQAGDGVVEHRSDMKSQDSAYEGLWLWHHPTLAVNWYGPGVR